MDVSEGVREKDGLLRLESPSPSSSTESLHLIQPTSKSSTFHQLRPILLHPFTFLLPIIIALTIAFHYRWSGYMSYPDLSSEPSTMLAFSKDPALRSFDEATSSIWEKLVPKNWNNLHFVDKETGTPLRRGVGMYHKMHCLAAIRSQFTELATSKQAGEYWHREDNEEQRLHIAHCFDFIRQDILCAADETLEPLNDDLQIEGWVGLEHECRDWTKLESFMNSH